MELEAVQLLNLSPIPELSELELSTMLEQLSGLSDINGDLTERNVEDILKEAEDLLDKSRNSDPNDLNSRKCPEPEEKKFAAVNNDENVSNNIEAPDNHQTDLNGNTSKSPVMTDHPVADINSNENENAKKYFTSPVSISPTKSYSSGASCNHIKFTIDSLKEFSTLVEKKLSQSPNSSIKHTKTIKEDEKGFQNNVNSQQNEKLIGTKESPKSKSVKVQVVEKKEPFDKSVKLLNCFERLYQDKPIRLMTCKKQKVADKIQKAFIKKKLSKELKGVKKNNRQARNVKRDILGGSTGDLIYARDHLLPKTVSIKDDSLGKSKEGKFFTSNNSSVENKIISTEKENGVTVRNLPVQQLQGESVKSNSPVVEGKLILKVLKEMEEIKDQVRKVGVFTDTQNKGVTKGNSANTGNPKPEVGSDNLELMRNTDIRRLEEQFSILREKYDHQLEKLETENCRLREVLNSKLFAPQRVQNDVTVGLPNEDKTIKTSFFNFSPTSKRTTDSNTPKNTPTQSPTGSQPLSKEAFAQTEIDIRSTSSQCSQEVRSQETRESREGDLKENKENVAIKKKYGKWKPFSDINIHHLMRQKKAFDHESQLLATVRGLQAEVSTKEKENRKLRTEVDSLRRQLNKWTNIKVDACRKCHIGTQTVGLGPVVQKPYNPENYEAAEGELQKENEELRSRIKAVEEDFETLKEKRISDLQALHQVHEEEMAKVVSKLETQSALTKHLHSLLVNR